MGLCPAEPHARSSAPPPERRDRSRQGSFLAIPPPVLDLPVSPGRGVSWSHPFHACLQLFLGLEEKLVALRATQIEQHANLGVIGSSKTAPHQIPRLGSELVQAMLQPVRAFGLQQRLN